jgi:hypothetical protein
MYPTEEVDPLGHARYDCHAPWDSDSHYWAVTCPDGYFLDTLESVHLACGRAKRYCPSDLACLCRPCIKDMVLRMYPVEVSRAAAARPTAGPALSVTRAAPSFTTTRG